MIRRSLVVIVQFLLAAPFLCGQKFIDLSSQVLDAGEMALVVDSVLVPFGNEACIGTVNERFDHDAVNVYLTEPIGPAIRNLCARSFRGTGEPQHIALRLSRLRVLGPRCSIHIEMIRTGAGRNDVLFRYGNSFVSGGDCSLRNQASNIAEALSKAFRAWSRRDASNTVVMYTEPSDRIADMATPPLLTEMQRSARTAPGLYHAYSDMLDGSIDTTMDLKTRETLNSTSSVHELKLRGDDQGMIRNCWGYTDGENQYINMLGRFAELKHDASVYYTYAIPQPAPGTGTDAVMWGAMFGLAGAMIATAASTPMTPIRFNLDSRTGELSPANHQAYNEPIGTEQIIHFSRYSKMDDGLTIRIDGREIAHLQREQYVKLKPIPCSKPVHAEIIASSGRVFPFSMDTNASFVQVQLLSMKKDGTVSIDVAKETMVTDILDKLKRENSVKAAYP